MKSSCTIDRSSAGLVYQLKVMAIALFSVVSIIGPTSAMAISVNESVDFPGVSSFGVGSVNLGLLDLGVNTVSGALAGNCDIGDCQASGDTQDSFLVDVGSGFEIDSVFVTTSNVNGPTDFSVSFSLRENPTTLIFEPFLPINSTSGNLAVTAIGDGTYSLSMFGQQASEAGAFSLDYSIQLNVSAVPVPATVWLFGSGLIGLISIARRKKTQRLNVEQ